MKQYGILVPGSVITQQTAPNYLRKVEKILYQDFDQASANVLGEIEERIVNAGFMTWAETEAIEIEVIKSL